MEEIRLAFANLLKDSLKKEIEEHLNKWSDLKVKYQFINVTYLYIDSILPEYNEISLAMDDLNLNIKFSCGYWKKMPDGKENSHSFIGFADKVKAKFNNEDRCFDIEFTKEIVVSNR